MAILGGAKVSDKIEVIENLGKVVDKLLIGGAMAYTFLKAQGQPIGKSLVEDDKLDLASKLLTTSASKLMLPVDHVVVSEIAAGRRERGGGDDSRRTRSEWISGRRRSSSIAAVITGAKTVIWNGPMGIFEKPPFDAGTVAWRKRSPNPARLRWSAAAIPRRPSKPPA